MPLGKKRELAGLRFGKWEVLALAGSVKDSAGAMRRKWHCRCECGNERLLNTGQILSGKSTNCGCWRKKHGKAPRKKPMPEYVAWSSMKQRCQNTKNSRYHSYGARGITVCPEWENNFKRFFQDMGPRPSPDHSIDRIDNNGNYEKSNCRWATRSEQQLNKRPHGFDNLPKGDHHWTRKDKERSARIASENIKNAHRKGEQNNNAKMTKAKALELRQFAIANPALTFEKLGKVFGVGKETARKVVRGIAW